MIERLRPKDLLLSSERYIPDDKGYSSKIYIIEVKSIDLVDEAIYCNMTILTRKREEERIDEIYTKTIKEDFERERKNDTFIYKGFLEQFNHIILTSIEHTGREEIKTRNAKSTWEYLRYWYPEEMHLLVSK